MPYSSNSELPSAVRGALPSAAQSVFRNVVNSSLSQGHSDQRAFRQGWAAVGRKWSKPADGGVWQLRAGKRKLTKGYPEYDPDQPRAADGTWGGGGGSNSASSPGKPAGESGWRRAGRYALAAGAMLAAASLGAMAAPYARQVINRYINTRAGVRRPGAARAARTGATRTGAAASPGVGVGKLQEALTAAGIAHAAAVSAKARSVAQRKFFVSELRSAGKAPAHVKDHLRSQIARLKKEEKRFSDAITRLNSKQRDLRARIKAKSKATRSKKRAMHKRHAPVYVCRYLVNAEDFVAWAKSQGFGTVIDPKDLHVTIAYSRQPMDWPTAQDNRLVLRPSPNRTVERLGDEGAVVLRFDSKALASRWDELRKKGASWDHDEYRPHVTISYRVPEDFDLEAVKPYDGELVFGPEDVRPLDAPDEHVEKMGTATTFSKALARFKQPAEIKFYPIPLLKAKDKGLGLVFGWSIISSENGKPYYDTQGDHIPEDSMLNAATEFMQSKRQMKIMHSGKSIGKVVFAWPMTQEIAEAMGVKGGRTGLMVAVKPDNPNVLERFREGKYSGFSIGGNRLVDEDEEDYTAKNKGPSAVTFKVLKAAWEESKHPRDNKGRFSSAGGLAAAGAAGAALAFGGAAGLGLRGARHLLPQIRRAVLAMRTRRARTAARGAAASFYSRGDFGSRRGDLGAAMGALTASGRENAAVNALRGQLGIQSLAARRRAARRRFAATGLNRPTSLWD